MRIEHIAMYVNDLEKAKNFFVHYSMRRRMRATITRQLIFVLISSHLMMVQGWNS